MQKYVVMKNRYEAVLVEADDNKAIKEHIGKGYGIVNRVRAKCPIDAENIRAIKKTVERQLKTVNGKEDI